MHESLRGEKCTSELNHREREEETGREARTREGGEGKREREGRYPADEPAMKPRRTRCLFLQSMEGYIHGLMAVYHARLLRSLSCVLGAHMREREQESETMRGKERKGQTERGREMFIKRPGTRTLQAHFT